MLPCRGVANLDGYTESMNPMGESVCHPFHDGVVEADMTMSVRAHALIPGNMSSLRLLARGTQSTRIHTDVQKCEYTVDAANKRRCGTLDAPPRARARCTRPIAIASHHPPAPFPLVQHRRHLCTDFQCSRVGARQQTT